MERTGVLNLTFPVDQVALLTLDDPQKGANILSSSVLDELEQHLDKLEKRKGLAALVFASAKPGIFIAGADLREFVQWIDADRSEVIQFCRRGQTLFGRLAKAPFMTIAAIDGVCLGGGAELAVWCDRRILSTGAKTQLGFPEVKLGLFPGWGGTVRAPRMIGLSNALELITSGEAVRPQEAYKLGLADDLAPPDRLIQAALDMVEVERTTGRTKQDRQRWAAPIEMSETELGFLAATASAYLQQQTRGHYPAPLAALELMLGAMSADVEQACVMEAEAFAELFGSPVNRALLNVFFLQDANKKDPGIQRSDIEPRAIRSVGVIGAGIMGQGIAAANVKRKVRVALTDVSPEALQVGVRGVLEEVSYNKAIKGPDVERAVELAPLVEGTLSLTEAATADLVLEAVVENADVKKKVLAELEAAMNEEAILASNTSTIPITQLAAGLKRPERFCGIHFFNPVRKMPLVEVIRGEKTNDETVATAVAYAKAIGKSPIVVGDGPGFLVNRILLPYMSESVQLLTEGATIKTVERAAKDFGMPMGPLTLFDVVGIDTAVHAGNVMYGALPDRVITPELLVALYKAGRLGHKSGAGFFAYPKSKSKGEPDPTVEAMIAERQREPRPFTPDQITHRLLLPMVLEATQILAEGLVRNVRDVDLGLIFGIGFPPFRGGLLFWADTIGPAALVEMLKPYEPLGKRYHPTEMLLDMARSGGRFYNS